MIGLFIHRNTLLLTVREEFHNNLSWIRHELSKWNLNMLSVLYIYRKYPRILHAILNKSCKQYPTKKLYSHLPSITQIIKDKQDMLGTAAEDLINVIFYGLLLIFYGLQPAKTYIHEPCSSTECCLEDLLRWLVGTDGESGLKQFVMLVCLDDEVQ